MSRGRRAAWGALAVVATLVGASFGERLAAAPPPSPGPTATPPAVAALPSAPAFTLAPAGPAAPAAPVPPTPRSHPSATVRLDTVLQRELDRQREALGLPGVSATIVFRDGSTWSGASGLADVATGRAVTPDTAFAAASMTKTFVAALILDLVEEGSIGLDEPVAPRLPELAVDPRITTRMLLDHTSGLHDYFLSPKIDAALQGQPGAAWTSELALGYVGKPYFVPGTSWRYSNTNYLLLGLLAERVTGEDLATALRTRFFGPLGLDATYYQVAERPRGPVAHGYRATGSPEAPRWVDLSDGSAAMPFTSVVTAAAGAGAVASTSADLARWAWHLYGGDVLEAVSLARMLGDVEQVVTLRPAVPYGLGVQALPVDRWQTLGHSGRFLGFRGALRYLPEEGVAVAVLTNQSRADPGVVVRALLDVALPPASPCAVCRPAA